MHGQLGKGHKGQIFSGVQLKHGDSVFKYNVKCSPGMATEIIHTMAFASINVFHTVLHFSIFHRMDQQSGKSPKHGVVRRLRL